MGGVALKTRPAYIDMVIGIYANIFAKTCVTAPGSFLERAHGSRATHICSKVAKN